MARIRLEEALALGLIPPDQVASLQKRFPAVGRSQMFGSPLFIQPSRGAGALQRNLFGFGPSYGAQTARFGLGPLLQRLGLSPPPSAVTSPGAVPTGSAARRREELTPEQQMALYGQMERAGASPRSIAPPQPAMNRLRVMGVTPEERQAIQEAAGPTGGDITRALAIARKAVGVSKSVLDDQSLLRQVIDPILGLERPTPPRSEEAFQTQRAEERGTPAVPFAAENAARLSQGALPFTDTFKDPRFPGMEFPATGPIVPGAPAGDLSRLGDLNAAAVEPVEVPTVDGGGGGGGGGGVGSELGLVRSLLDLGTGALNLSRGADPARGSLGLVGAGAGVVRDLSRAAPQLFGSSAAKVGNVAGAVGGAAGVGQGVADIAQGRPEGAFNVGTGSIPLLEAASVLPQGASWATLPLTILAISGAFGKSVQRMLGFGNDEQAKNQAREARVLARDVPVAGRQAAAGHRAVFDLGSLSGLPDTEQGKRLQELEHTILTGYNAAPVFSRAGGPARGNEDVDQAIGLVRARDAMKRMGMTGTQSLRGMAGGETALDLDPEVWLPRLAAYATAPGEPRLNLRSGEPQAPGTQTPEGYVENAGYDPTATYFDTLFPTPGRERTGTSEDASGNVSPTYNMPSSIQSAFPGGEFEARAIEFLRRMSPSFDESELAQRLGIVPSLAALPPPPGAASTPPPAGRMLTTPPDEGPGSMLSRAPSMQRGGIVPRTGTYRLHQGEAVIPAEHEQSETIQRDDGKWINIYGRNTPQAGTPLPYEGNEYETVEEAERAAQQRSDEHGKRSSPDLYAYLALKEGGVKWAKKNPDATKYWRLAFSPYEGREAWHAGDAGETPIIVPPNVTRLPGRRLVAAVEAARRAQHQDPTRTLGDFLSPAVGMAPPMFNTLSRGQGVMRDDGRPDEVRDTIVPLVPPPFLRQPPQPTTPGLRESVGVGI